MRLAHLRSKLLVMFLLVSIVPLAGVSAAYLVLAARAARVEAIAELSSATSLVTLQIATSLDSVQRELQVLRGMNWLEHYAAGHPSPAEDERVEKAILAFAARQSGVIGPVVVGVGDNPVLAVELGPDASESAADIRRENFGLQHRRFLGQMSSWDTARFLPEQYKTVHGLCVRAGIGVGSDARVVIAADFLVSVVAQRACKGIATGPGTVLLALDDSGTVISSPRPLLLGSSVDALLEIPDRINDGDSSRVVFDSQDYLAARSSEPRAGVSIIALKPVPSIWQSTKGYAIAAGLLTLSVAGLAALMVLGYTARLDKSLAVIETGVRNVAAGRFETRIDVRSGDELERLATAFNAMAHEIRSKTDQLARSYDALVESERLAAIGKVTAFIAHELKNPLGIVKVSCTVLRDLLRDSEQGREMSSIIMQEVERMDASVLRVLGYSHPAPPRKVACRVGEVVERAVRVTERMLGESSVVVRHERLSLEALVRLDPDQVHQVLLNLFMNAKQALFSGGTITIVSGLGVGWQATSQSLTACLAVRDSGPGVPAEIRDRIFEPFVTSTPGGSGLGLAICRQIMRAHGGDLVARAIPDAEGMEFALLFPVDSVEVRDDRERTPTYR